MINKNLLILCGFLFLQNIVLAQLDKLDLKNVVVVAQLDKAEERFTTEVNLAEILVNLGVKTIASLNAQKQGANVASFANDSIQKVLKAKGFDTYVLVSVRGYDNRFKPATIHNDLETELAVGHLFPLYRENISSVTLEFNFFRDGKFVADYLYKINGVSTREDVLKKMRKKLPRRIFKYWL
jgi:hypothetical protein